MNSNEKEMHSLLSLDMHSSILYLKQRISIKDYFLPNLEFNYPLEKRQTSSNAQLNISEWNAFPNSFELPLVDSIEFDSFHLIPKREIVSDMLFKFYAKILLIYPCQVLFSSHDLSLDDPSKLGHIIGFPSFVVHSDSFSLALIELVSPQMDLQNCKDPWTLNTLDRLYGIMAFNHLSYGFITNYQFTRFLHFQKDSLLISEPISCSSPFYFQYMSWFALRLKALKEDQTPWNSDVHILNPIFTSYSSHPALTVYKNFAWNSFESSSYDTIAKLSLSAYQWRNKNNLQNVFVRICDIQRQPYLYERMLHDIEFLHHLIALQGFLIPRLLFYGVYHGVFIYILEWIDDHWNVEFDLQNYSEYCQVVRLQLIDMNVMYNYSYMNPSEQTRMNVNGQVILTDLSHFCWLK